MTRPRSPVAIMLEHGVQPPSPAIAAILSASYGIPATAAQRALWPSLSQMPWPDHPVSTIVACIGRRGLKTTGIAAWVVVYEALRDDDDEAYATGRIYFVIVAPQQRQARESVRGVLAALDACGVEYTTRDPGGVTEIVLAGGGCERVIAVFTASDIALRGYAIKVLVLDECAFNKSDAHLSTTDKEILNAAKPGMAQFPAGKVVLVSTPGPQQGLFFEMVEHPPKGALLVRCPTWVSNPRITREKCLELSAGDDRLFRQEFEASRFGAMGEGFFDEDLLRRCEEPAQPPIKYEHGVTQKSEKCC